MRCSWRSRSGLRAREPNKLNLSRAFDRRSLDYRVDGRASLRHWSTTEERGNPIAPVPRGRLLTCHPAARHGRFRGGLHRLLQLATATVAAPQSWLGPETNRCGIVRRHLESRPTFFCQLFKSTRWILFKCTATPSWRFPACSVFSSPACEEQEIHGWLPSLFVRRRSVVPR